MIKVPWRLIPHEINDGAHNLALDAWLLKKRFPFPILRFYSWRRPCISYGYFQTPPPFEGLRAYRRVTGGGIVFHDKDLTYSLIYPKDSVLPWSIKRATVGIHAVIQRSLGSLGFSVAPSREESRGTFCFKNPIIGDLVYQGKKIAGAAQRRMGNHLLHQGTILTDQLGILPRDLIRAVVDEFQKTYQVTFGKD